VRRKQGVRYVRALALEGRQGLRRLGIRIGRHLIYLPTVWGPAAGELSVLLWGVFEASDPLLATPPA